MPKVCLVVTGLLSCTEPSLLAESSI